MHRVFLSAVLVLGLGSAGADTPAPAEQVRFDIRIVQVPASLYDRLKADFDLEARKPAVCDDAGLRELLDAVQANPDACTLSSPQIVTLVGQAATVEIGQEQSFQTGFRAVGKEGRVAFEPQTTAVTTGLKTTLTATRRPNGRGLEVDFRATGTSVERVENVAVTLPAGPDGAEAARTVQCPHVVRNTLHRTFTLSPGRTAVLPGWWEAEAAPKESQRVIVCVTARP